MLRQVVSKFLVLALICVASKSYATTFCVNSFDGLQAALDSYAQGNSVSIQLEQGTYTVRSVAGHNLGTFENNVHGASFQLVGGYTPGCASRVLNPANTILDGANEPQSYLALEGRGDVLVMGITVTHMMSNASPVGAALGIDVYFDEANVAVKYCRIVSNAPDLALYTAASNTVVWNNLITANSGAPYEGDMPASDETIDFTNNTIEGNTRPVNFLELDGGNTSRVRIVDNVFWNNGAVDVDVSDLDSTTPPYVKYNILSAVNGSIQPTTTNISSDPKFAGAGDYHLQPTSPGVNTGACAFDGCPQQPAGVPSQDLDALQRLVGSHIDRGAYESPVNDLAEFAVTTTADNGSNSNPTAGSLRKALKSAKDVHQQIGGGGYRITFDLPGCPSYVTLNSAAALPDIDLDLTIDGTTQAGWIANTATSGFNGNLCVNVLSNGALPYAFRTTGNGRLTLEGLWLSGFSDAAIRLDGGEGHLIQGNIIGSLHEFFPNQDGVRVSTNAGTTYIGAGDAPALRNLIQSNTRSGIYLDNAAGGSIVNSNTIGTLADGVTPAGNAWGIYVQDSPNNSIIYNTIDASINGGIALVNPNTMNTVVQFNTIGESGNGLSAGPQAVLVLLGAANNTLGANQAGTSGGNSILSDGTGVWIRDNAGLSNRVLANAIVAQDLAIDLGPLGATPNDPSDSDGMGLANNLQNYPLLSSAYRYHGSERIEGTLDTVPGDSYRLDFYARDSTGRAIYLGHADSGIATAGPTHFVATLPPLSPGTQGPFCATATDTLGDTSELGGDASACVNREDTIFASDFELQH